MFGDPTFTADVKAFEAFHLDTLRLLAENKKNYGHFMKRPPRDQSSVTDMHLHNEHERLYRKICSDEARRVEAMHVARGGKRAGKR